MQIYFWDCEILCLWSKNVFLRYHTCPDHRSDSFLSSFDLRHIYSCDFLRYAALPFAVPLQSSIHKRFAIRGLSVVVTVRNSRLRRKKKKKRKKGKPCCNQQYLRIQYYVGHLLMPRDTICWIYADITMESPIAPAWLHHCLSLTSPANSAGCFLHVSIRLMQTYPLRRITTCHSFPSPSITMWRYSNLLCNVN